MSKITIVKGDVLEYIEGKDLSFAKEEIINSGSQVIQIGKKKGVTYGDPKKSKLEEVITNAKVYFRPVSKHGEFGFDWLREADNGLAEKYDEAYKDIIESGYKDGRSDLSSTEAFEKLKHQYEIISMKSTSSEGGTQTDYFVPYLTLFSKEFVNGEMKIKYKNLFTDPKYEAELKVLVDIEEDIEKLEFDYNKDYFEIDKKVLKDKTKTNGLVASADTAVKITCLKDLPNEMEICIYAYPKNCQQPLIERKLAGKIRVLQNDSKIRKEEKIVLVSVKTNIYNSGEKWDVTGKFPDEAEYKLYNFLYQALIMPIIKKDKLSLSKNKDFQKEGIYIIESEDEPKGSRFRGGENNEGIK